MKYFAVIGDIHGCGKTLKLLLKKLSDKKIIGGIEEIYCVGDLIDRGPNTSLVMDLVEKHNIKTVLGNHEWLCMTGQKKSDPNYENWRSNGAAKTIKSAKKNQLEKWCTAFKSYPLYLCINDVLICHAGIKKGFTIDEACIALESSDTNTLLNSILWNRHEIYLPGFYIISGHSPKKKPLLTEHFCNIDTGCVYKHFLTAIIMPSKQIIQVPYAD